MDEIEASLIAQLDIDRNELSPRSDQTRRTLQTVDEDKASSSRHDDLYKSSLLVIESRLFNLSSRNGKNKQSPLPPPPSAQPDYDLNSVSSYVQGEPLTNGFLLTKINPVLDPDFMYLNRNKLVNRRLVLRKNCSSISDAVSETREANSSMFTLASSPANMSRMSEKSHGDISKQSFSRLRKNRSPIGLYDKYSILYRLHRISKFRL